MHQSLWDQLKNVFKKKEKNDDTILTNDINDPQNKARSKEEETSDFSQILKVENVQVDVTVASENELLKYLSKFASQRQTGLDEEKIYGQFLLREQQASTNLGDGIVLPHVIDDSIKELTMLVLKLENPIMWNNEKIDLVIGLLIPKSEPNFLHVKYLASISILLSDPKFLYSLKETTSSKEIADMFINSNN
ncbi:PTS sugar transporter subunit IIA [Companilactobacillus sp. HBUAS56275]|uniref:PTS sugar transporter subunit IIA n=1 Tax=Candidatus Companilactobacillus pullicola TaxID=2838523 RepID=A0A9D1ZQK2_9LACO|nr:PTS sugar transporter subunit IIA [Candidatus Companilactobacillus pullicola]